MAGMLTEEVLRKLQLVQLEMVMELDKICRDNDIVYQIFSGTLLGAVRHKGFIPWDDDLDVCLLRKDYDKLLDVMKKELKEDYFLQTIDSDPNFVHSFARLQKNHTTLVQNSWKHINMSNKIFIDIYPLDDVNPNSFKGKMQYHLTYQFKRIKRMRRANFNLYKKSFRTKAKLFFQKPFLWIPMHFYTKIETKIYTMLNDREENVSLLVDGGKETYLPYMYHKSSFYDVIDMDFEGELLMAPRNYDEILKRNFGDYMQLPKIEHRVPHHGIIEIDFDK